MSTAPQDAPARAVDTAQRVNHPPVRSRSRRRAFLSSKLAVGASLFLVVITASALLADVIAPYDYKTNDLGNIFARPMSGGHLLGTDDLGRDVFSRLLVGTRVSLLVGFGSVAVGLLIAVPLGLFAGYLGGVPYALASRASEVLLSIPPLVLVFAVAGVLGPGITNVVAALAIYFVPVFMRLVSGEARRVRRTQLVEAEIALGGSTPYILRRHVLPAVASPLIVQSTISVGVAVLAEASLSFLGLGAPPPTPTWGVMLRGAFGFIQSEAWLVLIPCAAIALTVLALNLAGDALHEAMGRIHS